MPQSILIVCFFLGLYESYISEMKSGNQGSNIFSGTCVSRICISYAL
jgi:hypothetical protein